MYKAPSFGLGMKKDLRESIESVYDINNTINEEEQLIISLFEEFLEENFHVEMLTEEDIDYILENEFPEWLEENEEYLTEAFPLYAIASGIAGAARSALPKILRNFSKRKINRRENIPQSEKSITRASSIYYHYSSTSKSSTNTSLALALALVLILIRAFEDEKETIFGKFKPEGFTCFAFIVS